MVKRPALLFLMVLFASILYGQSGTPTDGGSELTVGKTATLGVEATTTFVWDIENESTGLETKAGLELIFPLFAEADRGLYPESFDEPAVRLALRNASFTWWNTFQTRGQNYEQDDFNSWSARPLVLSFDTFTADVVWTNYFFRVASSTTVFQSDEVSLFSIFDEVMDTDDRWYYRRAQTRALWHTERYNIQQFPLLKGKIARDFVDEDYRTNISGSLAFGAEFESWTAAAKMASHKSGVENDANAWLFGADFEAIPFDAFKINFTFFGGVNYEKAEGMTENPVTAGLSLEYQIALSDLYYLVPKTGFDFGMNTAASDIADEVRWEVGAGATFYTRGLDYTDSYRLLDWDNIIPVGASLFMNMNQDSSLNVMLSWFEPAGRDSMIPYFGGFLQLEMANLLEADDKDGNPMQAALGLLAQVEYMIAEKFTPYVRCGYVPEFYAVPSNRTPTAITGNYFFKWALGCYMTPVHFFSIDLRYEMDIKTIYKDDPEIGMGQISAAFTVRM